MMLCLCNVFAENNLRFLQNEMFKNLEYSGLFNDKYIIFKFEEDSVTINYDGNSIALHVDIHQFDDDENFKVSFDSLQFQFIGFYYKDDDFILGKLIKDDDVDKRVDIKLTAMKTPIEYENELKLSKNEIINLKLDYEKLSNELKLSKNEITYLKSDWQNEIIKLKSDWQNEIISKNNIIDADLKKNKDLQEYLETLRNIIASMRKSLDESVDLKMYTDLQKYSETLKNEILMNRKSFEDEMMKMMTMK